MPNDSSLAQAIWKKIRSLQKNEPIPTSGLKIKEPRVGSRPSPIIPSPLDLALSPASALPLPVDIALSAPLQPAGPTLEELLALGQVKKKDGCKKEALSFWQKGLELAGRNNPKQMPFLHELAQAYLEACDLPRAEKVVLQGCKLALGDAGKQALFFHDLARLREGEGNWQGAHEIYQKILALEGISRAGVAQTRFALGCLFARQKKWKEALSSWEESKNLWEALGEKAKAMEIQFQRGWCYLQKKEFAKSIQILQACLAFAQEKDWREEAARYRVTLGYAFLEAAEVGKALPMWKEAFAYYQKEKDEKGMAFCYEAFAYLYQRKGQDAYEAMQKAMSLWEKLDQGERKSKALIFLGDIRRERREYEKAEYFYEEARGMQKERGDLAGEAHLLVKWARLLRKRENYSAALGFLAAALKIHKKLGIVLSQADTLGEMAATYRKQGAWEAAERAQESAFSLYDSEQNSGGKIRAFLSRGILACQKGDGEKAEKHFQDAGTHSKSIEDTRLAAFVAYQCGQWYHRKGQYALSCSHFREALLLYQKRQEFHKVANILDRLAGLWVRASCKEKAHRLYQRALTIRQKRRDLWGQARSYHALGCFFLHHRHLLYAMENFSRSLEIREQIEDIRGIACTYGKIAKTYLAFHRLDKAIVNLQRSLELREKFTPGVSLAPIYYELGRLCMQDRKTEEAKVYYKKSLEFYQTVDRMRALTIESELESLE